MFCAWFYLYRCIVCIGLEKVHALTSVGGEHVLRFDLKAFNESEYVRYLYGRFYVGDSSDFFRLTVGDYMPEYSQTNGNCFGLNGLFHLLLILAFCMPPYSQVYGVPSIMT